MIRVLIPILAFSFLQGQEYALKVWGFTCGSITMDYNRNDSLVFETQSVGIVDAIWPFKNKYTTVLDSESFGSLFYKKRIRQNNTDHRLKASWNPDKGFYEIERKDTLDRAEPVETIFTSLAKVQALRMEELDTKWFFVDHEGVQYHARFLWADSVNVWIKSDSIMCHHYRLDLNPTGRGRKILDQTDYFMENIVRPDIVRQLWVTSESPSKIVKAAVSKGSFTFEAVLNE